MATSILAVAASSLVRTVSETGPLAYPENGRASFRACCGVRLSIMFMSAGNSSASTGATPRKIDHGRERR